MKTAVEWLLEQINPYGVSVHQDLFEQAKVMEEQQKVEFALRAYGEKLSTSKGFVEIVHSMRTFKQQEQ